MIRYLRCTVTIDSVLANSKTQNAFLFTVNAIFRQSRLPPSGGTWKYSKAPSTKKTWRDSLPIGMLLSALSVLVVAQSSSEIPEGRKNNPVQWHNETVKYIRHSRAFFLTDTLGHLLPIYASFQQMHFRFGIPN